MPAPKFPDITVKLVGEDGNVFNVIGRTVAVLCEKGQRESAEEFQQRAFHECSGYDQVLGLVMEYVEVS